MPQKFAGIKMLFRNLRGDPDYSSGLHRKSSDRVSALPGSLQMKISPAARLYHRDAIGHFQPMEFFRFVDKRIHLLLRFFERGSTGIVNIRPMQNEMRIPWLDRGPRK